MSGWGSPADSAPLLERDAVLAELRTHLGAVERSLGRVLLLGGEAGVGKTAVLDRLVRDVGTPVEVLRGWCEPLSTPRPLGPWADVAAELGSPVLTEIECMSGGGVSPLLHAILSALEGRTLLLVLEDLHWADAATLDLLRLLARRIATRPTMLVVSYRDDELAADHPLRVLIGDLAGAPTVHRHMIEPLSPSAVAELAAGQGVDADELHRVTGGNPFFVTEVLGSRAAGIPPTVGQAVAGRLARVSSAARHIADVVAILGSPAPLSLVTDLIEAPIERARELIDAGVLRPVSDGLGFRHELARMAVLEAMPAYDRVAWHGRVLQRLRDDPTYGQDSALLAHHAEAACDAAAVSEYAPAAAAAASASGAHREAVAQYGRALRHAGSLSPPRRAALIERHAHACYMTGSVAESISSWEQAAGIHSSVHDRRSEGDALRWASYMLWLLGRNASAREAGLRAVRLLESEAPGSELAMAYGNLAEQTSFDSDLASTTGYANRAIEVGGQVGEPGVVLRASFSAAVATVFARDDGWDTLEELWRIAASDASMLQHACMFAPVIAAMAVAHRDLPRADRIDEQAVAYFRDYDLDMFLDYLRGARAAGFLHRGDWDRASHAATEVLRGHSLPPISRVFPNVALGLVRARRGDPDSWPPLDEAAGSSETTDLIRLAPAWEAQAEAFWLVGDDTAAASRAREALAGAKADADPWALGGVARWIVLAGEDPPEVPAAGPFALELAGEWRAAADYWQALGCPYDAALARLAGDVAAVSESLETFDSLGARPAAARARERLRALGVRLGARGPRAASRANPYGLTARQLEILRLVDEGLTGPQIAARLRLSVKTVGHHVHAALTKMGVHSRAEAVRKLADDR